MYEQSNQFFVGIILSNIQRTYRTTYEIRML